MKSVRSDERQHVGIVTEETQVVLQLFFLIFEGSLGVRRQQFDLAMTQNLSLRVGN